MARGIPSYEQLLIAVLQHAADRVWRMRDLIGRIADELGLSAEERQVLLPGGSTTVIASRVHWAKTYLKKAELVTQPALGHVVATEAGRAALQANPAGLTRQILLGLSPAFRAFATPAPNGAAVMAEPAPAPGTDTPIERIDRAVAEIDRALQDQVLDYLLDSSPEFFERVVAKLLLAMGYGGSLADAAQHLGGTGDGGVDGVIRQDQLGLEQVYVQAKRYQPGNAVSAEQVRGFLGALYGKGATKGVMITTSKFSDSAIAAATQPGQFRVVLIAGQELTALMVRFGVGVRLSQTIEIKRVDPAFFEVGEGE